MASPSASKYNKLFGTNILIVGGTTGIGFCVAEACIEHGARLVTITGATAESAARSVERLRTSYPASSFPATTISGAACDLANPDAATVEASVEAVLKTATSDGTDKLNHIAFLAGDRTGTAGNIAEQDLRPEFESLLAVRVYGALAFAKLTPEYVESSTGSSLTMTAGAIPDKPMAGRALVAGVGGTIVALGRGFAVDLAPVRVSVVSPGLVHTERFERMVPAAAMPGFLEMAKNGTLVKEVGRPEDTAEAYLYAMKDRFTTGEHIRSNGGCFLA